MDKLLKKRSWKAAAEELAWAVQEAMVVNNDRNENRQAQLTAALDYGMAVIIAARSNEPLPKRPITKDIV